MLNGMMSPQNMKILNMVLASYVVYHLFLKQGVRHNAQATVVEMLEGIGIQTNPTQKYVIVAMMLAYLFKDQLPIIADVFEKMGMTSATPITRLIDPKAAAVTDIKSIMKSEPPQMSAPPPSVEDSMPAPATAPGPIAAPMPDNLSKNFMQPVV